MASRAANHEEFWCLCSESRWKWENTISLNSQLSRLIGILPDDSASVSELMQAHKHTNTSILQSPRVSQAIWRSDKAWSPCQASNWAMFQTSVATNQMLSSLFVCSIWCTKEARTLTLWESLCLSFWHEMKKKSVSWHDWCLRAPDKEQPPKQIEWVTLHVC